MKRHLNVIFFVVLLISFARFNPATSLQSNAAALPTSPQSSTSFNLSIYLHGIGKGGDNVNADSVGSIPSRPQRAIDLEIYDSTNQFIGKRSGTLLYDPGLGGFTGTINGNTIARGVYTMKVKIKYYLRKSIPGIITITPGQQHQLSAVRLVTGDSNDDNALSILDYNMVLDCFSDLSPARNCADPAKKLATDFTDDGNVNQFDYNVLLRELSVQTGDAEPTPSLTAIPTSLPTVQPPKAGIWISREEIMLLPTSGTAWNKLVSVANDTFEVADMANQDSRNDVQTLGAALVAVRTNNITMRNKAVQNLMAVINTDKNHDTSCDTTPSKARSIAVARNLANYVIAADIIGIRRGTDGGNGTKWADYVEFIRKKKNCRNSPAVTEYTLSESHDFGSSNADALAGSSRIAAAIYLNDKVELEKAWQTFQRYAGDHTKCPSCDPNLNTNGKTWSYTTDPTRQVAVNPPGTTKNGHKIDGAIVNDQGRGGAFTWPPGFTSYPWEGLQGFIMQAEMLSRAGYPAYKVMDNAVLRAFDYQYYLSQQFGSQWYNNAKWQTWVVNKAYNKQYPTILPVHWGVDHMSFTDWTHAK